MMKMQTYKDEIVQLFHDLDMSQSDSFSELIIYESIDDLPLSEDDLERAKDLLDQLKVKDKKITEQIHSAKYKIKQLWSKLGFNNPSLVDIVETAGEIKNVNKAELIIMVSILIIIVCL